MRTRSQNITNGSEKRALTSRNSSGIESARSKRAKNRVSDNTLSGTKQLESRREKNPLGLPNYDENLSDGEEELVKALEEFDNEKNLELEDGSKDDTDGVGYKIELEEDIDGDDNEDDYDYGDYVVDNDDDDAPPEDISFSTSKQNIIRDKEIVKNQLLQEKQKQKERRRDKLDKLQAEKAAAAITADANQHEYISTDILDKLNPEAMLSENRGPTREGSSEPSHPPQQQEDLPCATGSSRFRVVDISNSRNLLPVSSMERAREFKQTMMNRMKRQSSKSLIRNREKRVKCGLTIASGVR